jgi:FkbM family methyltransferase
VTTGAEPHSSAWEGIRDHLADELRLVMRGRTTRDRWRIARMLAHNHLRVGRLRRVTERLPKRPTKEFDVSLRDGPSLRLRYDDVILIYIYGIGEYDVDYTPLGDVRTLLDLGGNVGLGSIYLNERLGLERVASVEPSGANFRLLEENFRRNLPQGSALQGAVVGEPGEYYVDDYSFPHQIRVVPGKGTVDALTLPEVLDRFELDVVDLLKIDIEGGEAAIFDNTRLWADRVRAVLGEVHPPLTVERAQEQLAEFGYEPLPVPDRPFFKDIFFVRKKD